MADKKKSYFRDRTVAEIRGMNFKQTTSSRNLVERIRDLDITEDTLGLRLPVLPDQAFDHGAAGNRASRGYFKRGRLIHLNQPGTRTEAYACEETPLEIIAGDFERELRGRPEQSIFQAGFTFFPTHTRDKVPRVVPFVWLYEGVRLFSYSEKRSEIEITDKYQHARRVEVDGAQMMYLVPSRTERGARYEASLDHVPLFPNDAQLDIILRLIRRTSVRGSGRRSSTKHEMYLISYLSDMRRNNDFFMFSPHDIAAYLKIMQHSAKETEKDRRTRVPWNMNPFPIPSRDQADFYMKLRNNVLIYDPALQAKNKWRRLHLAETSVMLARAEGSLENVGWDFHRDGKLADYAWEIPEAKIS